MKSSTRALSRLALLSTALPVILAACGGTADEVAAASADGTPSAPAATADSAAPVSVPRFADAHDACFRAAAEQIGAETPVSEINSSFSAETGELQVCTVDYQSPADPRKLVGQRLDLATGRFSDPYEIELSVSGDAAAFRLEDYVLPLSQVDAAALPAVIEAQKPALDGVYGRYAWTSVRLMPPGAFSDRHTLRLDLEGRLAANDVRNSGYLSVSTDGGSVVANHLLP